MDTEEKISYAQFQEALRVIREYDNQVSREYNRVKSTMNEISPLLGITADTPLMDTKISVRAYNQIMYIFNRSNHPNNKPFHKIKVGDLTYFSIAELLNVSGFGKKSICEIQDVVRYAGLKFK